MVDAVRVDPAMVQKLLQEYAAKQAQKQEQQQQQLVSTAQVTAATSSSSSSTSLGLSEAWAVESRHVGCYTGGKVCWVESTKKLGCLCNEELHLVDIAAEDPTQRIAQEEDGVLTFAVDPSGSNACTSHRSGLLRHFSLGDNTLLRSWKGHEQVVADVCFDARGDLVATGSVDRTAKVWDFTGYFCTHNFKGHAGIVSLVRFHPAKLQLVTISDAEARLWDLESSRCVGVLQNHLATISSLCFGRIKGGYQLITGSRDQVVNIWELEGKGKLLRSVPVFENVEGVAAVPTHELRQIPSGKSSSFARWLSGETKPPSFVVITVGDKCQLRVWNPLDGKCVATFESPHAAKGAFRQVHCTDHAMGTQIVTVGNDLNLMIWRLPDFKVTSHIMGHNEEIVHVQWIPELSWPEDSPGTKPQVVADRFVCIANDEHPRVVSCKGFNATLLRGHTDIVLSCDVSADGCWIATGGKDQSVRIWNTTDCRSACVLSGHVGSVSALSFPKRRPRRQQDEQPMFLISGSQDKTMKVWELPTAAKLKEATKKAGQEIAIKKAKTTVIAHTKEVNHVLVSPNNKLIASAGQDKLVRIWSYPEGNLLGECKGHSRGVWCVAFSPIDQVVASASADATIRLWNLRDFTPIRAFQGHSAAVLRVCFLANGMQLMSSSVDGLLKLWQIRTADCAGTFEEHDGKVWCIDILGNSMVSGASDSKICVWKDVTEQKSKERLDAQAEIAMKDSKIGLLVHEGKVEAALSLALDLNRSALMRKILLDHTMTVVGKSMAKTEQGQAPGKVIAKESLDINSNDVDLLRWVLSLSTSQLEKLVELLEQWNSNRKMAPMAQMLMGLLLLAVPPQRLAALEGMNATCGTILSYSSRHMARVDSLLQKTFLFDLVMQSAGGGLALEASKKDTNGHGRISSENALQRTMEVLLGRMAEDDEDEFVPGGAQLGADAEMDVDEDEDELVELPMAPIMVGYSRKRPNGTLQQEAQEATHEVRRKGKKARANA